MKRDLIFLIATKDGERAIFVDKINASEILHYLNQDDRHKKKFMFIAELILRGIKNPEVYDKEEIKGKKTSVTAMKFFKGQENDRIYCREFSRKGKGQVIVAIVLLEKKKTQKLTKPIKSLIEKISKYEYEIE
jgi:hypothetical protein